MENKKSFLARRSGGDYTQDDKNINALAMSKGTYIRKYYLHLKVKKAGFNLKLEKRHKTINIHHTMVQPAAENKYVLELQNNYNYGVQTSLI